MDQLSRNISTSGSVDISDTESLPYSVDVSDTDSVVESVGSAKEGWRPPTPKRRPGERFRRARRDNNPETQFMQFGVELRDVPVHAAWEFLRDHMVMVQLVPGVMDCFYYLEGDGGSGSVFLGNYHAKLMRPDEDKYLINKIEVRDDVSKFIAVRCVGGKYLRQYSVYFTFIKVLPDEVRGDSSSIIAIRLEYQLRNPDAAPPLDSKYSYTAIMKMIRDRYLIQNRVERPILAVKVAKRLRLRASQLRVGADDKHGSDDSAARRRKSRLKLAVNADEGVVRQGKGKPPMRKAILLEAGDGGMVFAKKPS